MTRPGKKSERAQSRSARTTRLFAEQLEARNLLAYAPADVGEIAPVEPPAMETYFVMGPIYHAQSFRSDAAWRQSHASGSSHYEGEQHAQHREVASAEPGARTYHTYSAPANIREVTVRRYVGPMGPRMIALIRINYNPNNQPAYGAAEHDARNSEVNSAAAQSLRSLRVDYALGSPMFASAADVDSSSPADASPDLDESYMAHKYVNVSPPDVRDAAIASLIDSYIAAADHRDAGFAESNAPLQNQDTGSPASTANNTVADRSGDGGFIDIAESATARSTITTRRLSDADPHDLKASILDLDEFLSLELWNGDPADALRDAESSDSELEEAETDPADLVEDAQRYESHQGGQGMIDLATAVPEVLVPFRNAAPIEFAMAGQLPPWDRAINEVVLELVAGSNYAQAFEVLDGRAKKMIPPQQAQIVE